ncbi:MAG: NAD(+)/NADH kinase [Candidatus Aenigmatarchaeota archaeon]
MWRRKGLKLGRVVITTKKTAYEHYREDNTLEGMPEDERGEIEERYIDHFSTLERVKDCLENMGISYQIRKVPSNEDITQNVDLVISVGGDGTVLNTAHKLKGVPLLPVRADGKSHGALCTSNIDSLESILEDVKGGEEERIKWTRLEFKGDNIEGRALNEIFIGRKYSTGVARYIISKGGLSEEHMNSGLVISTGAGSTGWYSNISGNYGSFPRNSRESRFIVRESIRDNEQKLNEGILREGENLQVKSKMNVGGVISLDGNTKERLYEFPRGKLISLKISDYPLKVIRGGEY